MEILRKESYGIKSYQILLNLSESNAGFQIVSSKSENFLFHKIFFSKFSLVTKKSDVPSNYSYFQKISWGFQINKSSLVLILKVALFVMLKILQIKMFLNRFVQLLLISQNFTKIKFFENLPEMSPFCLGINFHHRRDKV